MTRMMKSCFVTLATLFLWQLEEGTEACSCIPSHPQQAFCNSDVVFRAKVIGAQVLNMGNDSFVNPFPSVKYDIKMMKMFKGPTGNIDAVYTASSSAPCGVSLDTNGEQYLITGRLEEDGTVHITLCNFFQQWDTLSNAQKLNLIQRYQTGCDCKITYCSSIPCMINGPAECLWTDFLTGSTEQARAYACIMRSDGSCSWYRNRIPSKAEH
ncbi:metalloproteinase inhibitor 2 [Austrofundulus limnaeus]|uniref:Metalloproteinase inhibitor 2 n=1 Tax=Austrofundulus limnaeus TaxID=52670 RepID=A0A2I4BCL6_AUSLI|nr:PREDICTED: metalloproteinase inhibitor 2-like [Austrofundulus limnaeus]